MKKVNYTHYRIFALVLALALILATVMPANIDVQASESRGADIAAAATPGDADGIYQADDGYFYYYVGGEKVAKTGWVDVQGNNNLTVKLDSESRIIYKAEVSDGETYISAYDAAKKEFARYTKNVIELKDKKLYYADVNGVIVTKEGTQSASLGTTYIIGKNGIVTAKFVKTGEVRKYYIYAASKWNVLKNAYKTFDGRTYYFCGNGIATKMYDNSEQKLYRYANSKMTLVKNDVSTVSTNIIYLFGSDGKRVTESGWYRLASGTKVYVGAKGCVTAKINVSGKSGKYSTYNYKTLRWVLNKNAWKTVDGTEYYYAGNGVAVYAYSTKTGKYTTYKNGAWTALKNSTCKLRNGRIYLTNSKSVVVKKAGWYSAGADMIYVGSKGYVIMKFSGKSGKLTKYNYSAKKWELLKKSSYKVGTKTYYFASNGVAVYAKDTKTGKITARKSGRWSAVKSAVCKLDGGKLYLVNAKSVALQKSGWYSVGADKVYVGSKGYVTVKFNTKSGKLTKYNYNKNKWELMKVVSYKIGSKTYYFNSAGIAVVNGIAGNSQSGYFYVDETGCKVTSKEIQMAVDFVINNTKSGMNSEEKLKVCYYKLSKFPYQRDYTKPSYEDRFRELAIDALTNGTANCYRYASAFACIATVLGYEARVTCGLIPPWYNGELTMHGWTELWTPSAKQWRVYDPCKEQHAVNESFYNRDISTFYPGSLVIERRARLTVKNGQDRWFWQ